MDDTLYQKARELLRANPELGKQKLGQLLGVHPPMGRRLKERFRGETEGHRTDSLYQQFLRLKTANPGWGCKRVMESLRVKIDIAQLLLARYAGATARGTANAPISSPHGEAPAAGAELQDTVSSSSRDLSYKGERIRTLEDLLVYAQVDTRTWEVERHTINKWEVGSRGPDGETLTAPLFQIKAWLRRKLVEGRMQDLLSGMFDQFKQAAPSRPTRSTSSSEAGMLEVSIMDLHYGKLAWGPESGRDYNADIAKNMFWAAVEDLISKGSGFKPGKILFPVGNDFFNTDILGRTTTSGTGQDEMMVWKESFVYGRKLLVQAIDRLREVAPVHVVVVNGNHDTQRAFYLGEVLAAWFGKTAGVTVDNAPTQRKYVHYGANLIAFSHGNHERHANLPLLMATESPEAWARSRHREWHIGHWHVKRHKVFIPAEDQQGVMVRIVPSLCPADAWHASMGYGGKLAAEAYYWSESDGCVATFTHSPV